MKKAFSALIIVIALLFAATIPVSAAEKEISVYLDGEKIEFDVKPQTVNDRTMVPIRAIFEAMGADVQWDDKTNTAISTKNDIVIKMTIGSSDMYVNDKLVKMDVSPVEIGGRTLAPARYVAEAMGADVQWSQKNNTVVICSENVFAYADHPDIPDFGRCYGLSARSEEINNGFKTFVYIRSAHRPEMNDEYYASSAKTLGGYKEKTYKETKDELVLSYTKEGESEPSYYIGKTRDENGMIVFSVMIPYEEKVTLYAEDGRTIEVMSGEVPAYLKVGWHETIDEVRQTLYSLDGRTITVFKSEVPAYKRVGWYETLDETRQTLYAPDGRTITVFKSEVPAYKKVGWYETLNEAQAANKPVQQKPSGTYNPGPDGYYYVTPTGKRYHLDPNCGGKNSYRTNNIGGLSPCQKCAR